MGPIEIPDANHFFFILNKRGIYALTSRRDELSKTVKYFSLDSIKPIIKGKKGLSGGLEDLGNFREGFCFRILGSHKINWIMCGDALSDKENWMSLIEKVKTTYTEFVEP